MRKTNTVIMFTKYFKPICLSIALNQPEAGPRSLGTSVLILVHNFMQIFTSNLSEFVILFLMYNFMPISIHMSHQIYS